MMTLPKAAMNKDGPFFADKNDAKVSWKLLMVDAIAATSHSVDELPESQFWRRVPAPHFAHVRSIHKR